MAGKTLWREVIAERMERWRRMRTNMIRIPFAYGVRRNIMERWDAFNDNIGIKIGEGSRVSFWGKSCLEVWCLRMNSRYCIVTCQREVSVQQVRGSHRNGPYGIEI